MDNRIREAFDGVRAEDARKQRTKAYLAKRMQAAALSRRVYIRRLAVACLALLLLGGWRFYETPVSAISVDVNPSVELGVNHFDRVVSVNGYNKDGTALAAAVRLKNLSYADALDTLLSSAEMQAYLQNNALVSVTVIGRTDAKSEEMRARIAACSYAAPANVECRCADRDEASAAHAAGLSFGKYRAFLTLQSLDPGVTAEEVRGLTMRQIRDRIAELSEGSGGNAGENDTDGHGEGGQHHGGHCAPAE